MTEFQRSDGIIIRSSSEEPGSFLSHTTLPAIEFTDRSQMYCFQGQIHREDGPAVVVPDEMETWYKNGKIHRENGPAMTNLRSGTKMWMQNGVRHREDGPAVEKLDGTHEYWLEGEQLTGRSLDRFLTVLHLNSQK